MSPRKDRPDPAAVRHVLRKLREGMDEADAAEPHVVLVHDPQTGRTHAVGPYHNRLTAKIAAVLIKARSEKDDPELADLAYETVLCYPPGPIR
jgi:hypothetical protein